MNVLSREYTKDFWKKVREKDCYQNYRDELSAIWENECSGEISELPFSAFMLCFKTGDRSVYEKMYFRRRRAISAASILALIYPEEEKYLNRLTDEIFAITNEYTWCVPAHIRDLHDWSKHEIDLFECETAFALSEIYLLLEDRLDTVVKTRIYDEVNRRVILPYREKAEKYDWESLTNNWAAVCSTSVAGAVMCLRPDLFDELMPRFNHSFERFLSGYNKDAMCLEGVTYWYYGFGFFTVYADMVRTFTNGRIDYFAREHVKNIATFMQKMYLSGFSCVSFADGARSTRYHLGLIHRLKREYPNDVLSYPPSMSHNEDHCGRFCLHLRSAMWLEEEYFNHPDEASADLTFYAEDSQWFIKKTPAYGFAAKGGNNEEHHNHNDVGSFIFAKNGEQLLMDLGAGEYSKKYFSAQRYELLHTSSRGHSVPIIDGELQKAGAQYCAKNVFYKDGVFSADIAGAYGCETLRSLKRSFSFDADAVYLTDEIEYIGEGSVTERFIASVEPIKAADSLQLDDCTLSFDPSIAVPVIKRIDEEDGLCGYIIDFVLPAKTKKFALTIRI